MTRKPTKFAVPLNTSVSKETYDRAQKLQQSWDGESLTKFDKRFRMSDLAEIVWDLALGILESLPRQTMFEAIAEEKIGENALKVEIRKARRRAKAKLRISDMTDDQVNAMINGKSEGDEE